MSEYNNIKIQPNIDYNFKFMHDSPIQGENSYGQYNLYNFEHNGESVSLFATDALHNKIQVFQKDDTIIVRKQTQPNGKMEWVVIPTMGTPERTATSSTPNNQAKVDDRTKDIHRQVCLKLAVQSMGISISENLDFDMVKMRMEGLLNVLEGESVVS